MDEPQTLKADRRAPLRSCIVTREAQEKAGLVRFVVGPEGAIVPDVGEKLPGRGYWVSCQKTLLEKAITQKHFLKASKGEGRVAEGLLAQTQALLEARALQSLALANKAGQLVAGFEKAEAALKSGKAIALVHAADASEASMKKLPISDEYRFCGFQSEALSAKLGLEHAVHLALLAGQAGESSLKEIRRFTGFLQS
jgi:predicted RNA-binding protein YlxR (DUF448 family)